MTESTVAKLRRLREIHGDRRFGKLVQKLLAICLQEAGYYVVEREVQGVDVDAARGSAKYAIEVKTTGSIRFALDGNNVDALRDRLTDGYCPAIAVLRVGPLSDWLIAELPPSRLRPATYLLDGLRPHRLAPLESVMHGLFDGAVAVHFDAMCRRGTEALNACLRRGGAVLE